MKIPDQLFIAGRDVKNLDPNRIQKAINQTPKLQVTDYKPIASSGSVIWTSTLVGRTTDWLRFCKYMEDTFGSEYVGDQGVIFEVSSSAKLYRIDSDAAWLALGEKYGKVENAKKFNIVVEWAKVQQDYDGVFHARGVGFWDAESTVWLNPKVLSVKRVVDLDRGCSIPSIKMAEKKNIPTNQELWDKVIKLTKGELKELSHNGKTVQSPNEGKGFTKYPSAYANGWAAKTYKDMGGKWKKESSEYKLPRKFDKEHCESKTCDEMGFSERASCAPYKSCPSPKKASGGHKLPPLPYEYDALEPYISKETLHFHHTKHHQAYVDGLNKAEIGLEKAREGLQNERMINAHTEDIAFNWGGHYLHTLYWRSLTPSPVEISKELSNLIGKDFGSIEKFGFNFKEVAKGVKGSGWAVLVLRHSTMGEPKLEILGVKNHEHHILWNSHVLLPIDVWEHAYYLDNQNDRGGHFDKVFNNLIDWSRVEERLTEAMTYQVATQKLATQRVASMYLAKGIKYDWGRSHSGVYHSSVYDNGKLVGTIGLKPFDREEISSKCYDEFEWVLREIEWESGSTIRDWHIDKWIVFDVYLNEPYQKKGIGYKMYENIFKIQNHNKHTIIVGYRCENGGTTSYDAEKVYKKLKQVYIGKGLVVSSIKKGKTAKGKAKKDVGKGGLDEWFSGHGQGKNKNEGKATWGDWVAISPVKRTITKEDGTKKTYEAGDIIGPCGSVSDDPNWKDLTNKGKSPLKCMARPKAHKMKKEERAELAKNKMKAEKGNNTQKPTNTPTFKKEKKKEKKKAMSINILNEISFGLNRGQFLLMVLSLLENADKSELSHGTKHLKRLKDLVMNQQSDLETSRQGISLTESVGLVDVMHKEVRKEYDRWAKAYAKSVQQKLQNMGGAAHEGKHMKYKKASPKRIADRYLQAGKKDFRIHHRSYTSAMEEAYAFAKKNGYSLIEDDIFQQVTTGRGKPSVGETRKHSLLLMKGDKMQRKALQVQVYGLENGYELNVYIL